MLYPPLLQEPNVGCQSDGDSFEGCSPPRTARSRRETPNTQASTLVLFREMMSIRSRENKREGPLGKWSVDAIGHL